MKRMYSTLREKPEGPGVDTLIGAAHGHGHKPTAAPVVVKSPPATCRDRPTRSPSRERREDQSDRRKDDKGRDDKGRGGNKQQDKRRRDQADDFCFEDFLYVFRVNRRACIYGGGCYKIHLADIRKSAHPLRAVEAQMDRERRILGDNFKVLQRELVENIRSPYLVTKDSKA
jgi:hypothetical protein